MKMKIFLPCILLALMMAACTPKVQKKSDAVSVQLKWVHQAQFGGLYLAQEKGYYLDENLAVTLIEGGSDIDPIEAVLNGKAQIGISGPSEVFLAKDSGAAIKVIATIFQRNPAVFVAMGDSGITSPYDFVGKKIAVQGNEDYEIQLEAMLKKLGITLDQVDLVPHTYETSDLTEGQVDVQGYYSTGGLLRLRNAGNQVNLIWPDDYGLHLNSDCIFTTDEFISNNPDLIERFLRATLKGWQYAIGNVDETVDATLKYALEEDRGLQAQMMEANIPLIHTGDVEIGWIDVGVWQNMQKILLDKGLLQSEVNLDEVLYPDFIQDIYGIHE